MPTTCIACGMPMQRPEDWPGGDTTKNYCVHCARQDGSMQTYTEKRKSLAAFLTTTQGLDPKAADEMAALQMARLPAWQNREG